MCGWSWLSCECSPRSPMTPPWSLWMVWTPPSCSLGLASVSTAASRRGFASRVLRQSAPGLRIPCARWRPMHLLYGLIAGAPGVAIASLTLPALAFFYIPQVAPLLCYVSLRFQPTLDNPLGVYCAKHVKSAQDKQALNTAAEVSLDGGIVCTHSGLECAGSPWTFFCVVLIVCIGCVVPSRVVPG